MIKCDLCINKHSKLCSECFVRGDAVNFKPANEVHKVERPKELVSHPDHYNYSKYEPKDVIRAWGLNFNLGNAVKYIARAGRKDDILQELRKAKQYLEFEIEAIEEERNERK